MSFRPSNRPQPRMSSPGCVEAASVMDSLYFSTFGNIYYPGPVRNMNWLSRSRQWLRVEPRIFARRRFLKIGPRSGVEGYQLRPWRCCLRWSHWSCHGESAVSPRSFSIRNAEYFEPRSARGVVRQLPRRSHNQCYLYSKISPGMAKSMTESISW